VKKSSRIQIAGEIIARVENEMLEIQRTKVALSSLGARRVPLSSRLAFRFEKHDVASHKCV
jgi:hypothetical protein